MKAKKGSISDIIFHIVFVLFCFSTLLPFLLTLIVSFSDEMSIIKNGYQLFPDKLSLDAYGILLSGDNVFNAYKISIIVTVSGTLLALLVSSMLAYAISVEKVKYRNVIALFMFFTMLFGAGLVPWYIVMTQFLHLKNSILALIVPMLVSPYNVFLIRNYFKSLPKEMVESAEIEGATPLGTLVRVIIPLSAPIIATVSLFISLGYWNDWNLSLWLIDKRELYPIQFMLYKINSLINYMKSQGSKNAYGGLSIPKESVQYATVMITIGPIILVYPFIQKYFVKGIMIGAVKG